MSTVEPRPHNTLVALAIEACPPIHVHGWLALALARVLLVVCTSFVERFGRQLAGRARSQWSEISQWDCDAAGGAGRTTRIALTSCARRGRGVEGGASQRSH